jgi:hypothetical protein
MIWVRFMGCLLSKQLAEQIHPSLHAKVSELLSMIVVYAVT